MRKIFMLPVTCVLTIGIYAQSITFGIKGGVNMATLGNNGTKIAYHAGILTNIPVKSKWSIQPEVLYSRQGITQGIPRDYHINLDYLNVPVLLQYLVTTGLKVEAGPQIGFLLSAKSVYQGVERDIKSNYESIDISFPIGLSYSWASGLGIDGRWVPGLSEIQKDYGSSKNSVLQLGAFYQFNSRNTK